MKDVITAVMKEEIVVILKINYNYQDIQVIEMIIVVIRRETLLERYASRNHMNYVIPKGLK